MEAHVPKRLIIKFAPRLQEGGLYYIRSFEVLTTRTRYRPVDHPYRGRFTAHTRITPVADAPANFPCYAYKLSTFDELGAKSGFNVLLSGTFLKNAYCISKPQKKHVCSFLFFGSNAFLGNRLTCFF